MITDAVQVITTVATTDDAKHLAKTLLEARLAACVQIQGPIRSMYWWQGELLDEAEYLCVIKTTADRFSAVEALVSEHHPYETPEIMMLPFAAGSEDYVTWLRGELKA